MQDYFIVLSNDATTASTGTNQLTPAMATDTDGAHQHDSVSTTGSSVNEVVKHGAGGDDGWVKEAYTFRFLLSINKPIEQITKKKTTKISTS